MCILEQYQLQKDIWKSMVKDITKVILYKISIKYNLPCSLMILFETFYYYLVYFLLLTYVRQKIIREQTSPRYKKAESPNQQLSIKTTSIHNYSQLEHLKESLTDTQPIILIARIKPIISKDPEAEVKLVKDLYSSQAIKNNYSIFQLGEERIIVVPNSVKSQDVLL
jgi:SepF-like predicted cell division protein (DUF552 family)